VFDGFDDALDNLVEEAFSDSGDAETLNRAGFAGGSNS
jgi:hypothetical protein